MGGFKIEQGIHYKLTSEKISYDDDAHDLMAEIEDKSFWFKHRNEVIKIVSENYLLNKQIYDIGGGNGFVTKYFQDLKYDITMIEPGIKGVINAKKRGVEKIYCCTVDEMEFDNGSVDGFIFFDVLEHIKEDRIFLENLHLKLKQDGIIVMTVPAKKCLWSEEDEIAGHYRRYEKLEIEKILEESGYKLLFSSYFFEYLVVPIFLLRRIKLKFSKKINAEKYREKAKKQHRSKADKNLRALEFLNMRELNRLKNGKTINIGSSLIVVAQKKDLD